MSPRIVIIALLPSALLGILCAHLYAEVQRERERVRTESALRSGLQARLATLDGTRAQLERRQLGQVHDRANEQDPQRSPPGAASATIYLPPTHVEPATASDVVDPRPSAAQLEWMRSPIARDLTRAHQREWLRRSNEELFDLLDLSPEQADSLIALMADGQIPPFEFGSSGVLDPAAIEEMQNKMREQQRDTNRAIRELLGEEKYRAYTDYQGSAMERMQVAELSRLFEATPTPLGAEQAKQILAAFIEERTTVPQEWMGERVRPTPEDLQRYQQAFEERELRVRERIAALLTPEQLERYTSYQQMQDAMRQDAGLAGGVVGVRGGVMFSSSAVSSPE
ncbi:MAG TPA: hypothetical protein VLD59_03390 [Steroidobacteraceae bacterium]|nr:hypothetical protein [Steroidobacteraceae bacterium]